ncbi:hypothetical protein OROGR_027741 [Orobanche gracilis]
MSRIRFMPHMEFSWMGRSWLSRNTYGEEEDVCTEIPVNDGNTLHLFSGVLPSSVADVMNVCMEIPVNDGNALHLFSGVPPSSVADVMNVAAGGSFGADNPVEVNVYINFSFKMIVDFIDTAAKVKGKIQAETGILVDGKLLAFKEKIFKDENLVCIGIINNLRNGDALDLIFDEPDEEEQTAIQNMEVAEEQTKSLAEYMEETEVEPVSFNDLTATIEKLQGTVTKMSNLLSDETADDAAMIVQLRRKIKELEDSEKKLVFPYKHS